MRKICIITGTRAEYGLFYWLMKEIQEDADLELLRRNVGGTKVMQLSRNVPHYHYSDLTDLLDNNRKLALDTILHCRWKYKTTSPIRR